MLSGCVRVENQFPDLLKVEDKVNVTFGVQVPVSPDGTKAFGNTPTINNLYIAVFDKGGMLTEYVKAESNPYANVNSSITNGVGSTEFTYAAKLSVSDYPCTLHFIANGPEPSELTYGSEAEVLNSKAFIDPIDQDRYWQRVQVPSIKEDAQIEGEVDATTKALLSHVALIRNFAKITVSANADDFTLVGFYTMNTMDKGMTAAYNRNTGKFIENYQNYSAEELIDSLSYNANVPITASLKTGLSTLVEVDGAGFGSSFLFEREKPTADPTYVIIAGKYSGKKHDSSITSPTYYKIDLRDEKGSYFPFLRNFNYQINIYEVNKDGYATPEEAAYSASSSADISTSIEAKDLTNISDGTSRMFVDYTEMILIGNNDCVFRYKYIPDLSWGDEAGVARIFNGNDYVALSLEDPGINGHALTNVFDVAETDDEDGYRKVTVHPTDITDAIKSSVVKIVGSYPGGQTEHDGKKVDIAPIQRAISFTLRDSLDLQVSCNPADIQKQIGQDLSVFLKIEDGLSSSIFSLDFYLEVEKLSLTSDELPVRSQKSIIPGNTEPAFQFLKTITWAEYEAAEVDEYGYKTFECKLKSNTAISASKIYVYNPYFHLGRTEFGNFDLQRFTDLGFSKTSNVHEADPETFTFKVGQLAESGNVIATLYNLEPSATEAKMTRLKANSDGSVDYEVEVDPNSTVSLSLVVNDYEGNAKVVLNATHYAEATSPLVQISQAQFSNPAWTGKPMSAGDALTFTFKMNAAPQTYAESGASIGRAIVVIGNAKPASDETHLKPVPGQANTYYYAPYGTDNASVAAATQTIRLTAVERGTVTISVSADHFADPNPLQSSVAPLPALNAPTISEGTVTAKTINVSWNAISNAAGYDVYYLHNGVASAPVSLGSNVTSYKFEGLDPENEYTICVIAKGDNSNYVDSVPGTKAITTHSQKKLKTPVVTFDESTASASTLTFNWTCEDESHVQSYDIYLDNVKVSTAKTNTYKATGLKKGTTHTLSVVANGDGDEYLTSEKASAQGKTKNATKLNPPVIINTVRAPRELTFAWDAVEHATAYEVSTDGVNFQNWNATSCTVTNIANNTKFTLYVRAISNSSDYETSDIATCTATTTSWNTAKLLAAPALTLSSTHIYSTAALIDFDEVSGADSYELSLSPDFSNSIKVADSGQTHELLTGLSANTTYTVYVRALSSNTNDYISPGRVSSYTFKTAAESQCRWSWDGRITNNSWYKVSGSKEAVQNAPDNSTLRIHYYYLNWWSGGQTLGVYTSWNNSIWNINPTYTFGEQTHDIKLNADTRNKIINEGGLYIKTGSAVIVSRIEIL